MSNLEPKSKPIYPRVKTDAESDLHISPLVLGGGVFGYDYNSEETLTSDIPTNTLRLALRYGINTIDTSPYYTTSEDVLGRAFAAVADEFPRDSYYLITKAGRYGRTRADGFDYSPARIRASIAESLRKMGTTYLDAVYMHDVEFVSEEVGDELHDGFKVESDGTISDALKAKFGLLPGQEDELRSEGDQKVLDAMQTLFDLKKEGLIRAVGMSAYPLPTLVRLSNLIKARLGQAPDIVQTYAHFTLQNASLAAYTPLLYAAGVKCVTAASPLSMGYLTDGGGPKWHFIREKAPDSVHTEAVEAAHKYGLTLQDVAFGYGFASASLDPTAPATLSVVGFSTPDELHDGISVYNTLYGASPELRIGRLPGELPKTSHAISKELVNQVNAEKAVVAVFKKHGLYDFSWKQGL